MINTLLATKKGMTSGYDARGRRVGATILVVEPNFITQVKTAEGKDGYDAVQLGFGSKKGVKKPQLGHLKKAKIEQGLRFMKEIRTEGMKDVEPGQQINVNQVFSKGDVVKVTATSKGKGFQGGVKRYNFKGGPKTHGQSDRHRAPGSSGSGTTPGRVYKGHRGPGHYGAQFVSYLNLEVLQVDQNLLTIKGGVPGPVGGLVMVKNVGKVKGYTPPPEEKEEPEEEINKEENEQIKNQKQTAPEIESQESKKEGETNASN